MRIRFQFPFLKNFGIQKYEGANTSPVNCNRICFIFPLPTRKWFYCRGGWKKVKWIRIFGLLIEYGKW